MPDQHRLDAINQAATVLEMPEATRIFGPGSLAEVSVAIDPPKGVKRMIGRIDRLILGPDEALIVDLKTDAVPPEDDGGVDKAYLAQLGAYASAIGAQWPEHRVSLAILWTSTPKLMQIPIDAARAAFQAASFGRNTGA